MQDQKPGSLGHTCHSAYLSIKKASVGCGQDEWVCKSRGKGSISEFNEAQEQAVTFSKDFKKTDSSPHKIIKPTFCVFSF